MQWPGLVNIIVYAAVCYPHPDVRQRRKAVLRVKAAFNDNDGTDEEKLASLVELVRLICKRYALLSLST